MCKREKTTIGVLIPLQNDSWIIWLKICLVVWKQGFHSLFSGLSLVWRRWECNSRFIRDWVCLDRKSWGLAIRSQITFGAAKLTHNRENLEKWGPRSHAEPIHANILWQKAGYPCKWASVLSKRSKVVAQLLKLCCCTFKTQLLKLFRWYYTLSRGRPLCPDKNNLRSNISISTNFLLLHVSWDPWPNFSTNSWSNPRISPFCWKKSICCCTLAQVIDSSILNFLSTWEIVQGF